MNVPRAPASMEANVSTVLVNINVFVQKNSQANTATKVSGNEYSNQKYFRTKVHDSLDLHLQQFLISLTSVAACNCSGT